MNVAEDFAESFWIAWGAVIKCNLKLMRKQADIYTVGDGARIRWIDHTSSLETVLIPKKLHVMDRYERRNFPWSINNLLLWLRVPI